MTTARATRTNAIALSAGLVVLAAGMMIVRDGSVSAAEARWFDTVNGMSDGWYFVMWPFQQLGALIVGPLVAMVAMSLRHRRLAVAVLGVTVLKLVFERVVKLAVSRQRPGTSIGSDIDVRGDVHLAGESVVSGHAVLVAGMACVATPYLPSRWRIAPWLIVAVVMIGRVYVGAHNPLDVIGGLGLGLAIAGVLNALLGLIQLAPSMERAGSPPSPAAEA